MMIELSEKQVQLLQSEDHEPVEVINPTTKEEFVLLRREVYETLRFQSVDNYTSEDAFRAQIESAAAAGWDDPALDVYNDVGPKPS